jgi:hypothetical protein
MRNAKEDPEALPTLRQSDPSPGATFLPRPGEHAVNADAVIKNINYFYNSKPFLCMGFY